MIWVETADTIEPDMTYDLWSRPDITVHSYTSCVKVRRPREPVWIVLVFPKATTPNTSKSCDGDQHLCHAPFNRLFFCRSTYNSSCSRLIWPTNLAPSPFPSAGVDAPVMLPASRDPFTFFARLSSRAERSATIRAFCRSSS